MGKCSTLASKGKVIARALSEKIEFCNQEKRDPKRKGKTGKKSSSEGRRRKHDEMSGRKFSLGDLC